MAVLGVTGSCEDAQLAAGQFHDVVLIGEMAYRFPRDEESCRALPAGVALLATLGQAGLPVPVPLADGHIRSPLGQCHVPLTRLPGQPLGQIRGERAARAVVRQLASLLDRIAELGADPAIATLVPRAGADHWATFASQVRHVLYPLMSSQGRIRAVAELAATTTLAPAGGALVHTDLGGANLLWTTAGGLPALTGVLDWDGACTGDQASDLASIAVTIGWPLAARIDTSRAGTPPDARRRPHHCPPRSPSSRPCPPVSGDQASLDDGLRHYR